MVNLDGLPDWPENPEDPWALAVRGTFDTSLSDRECFLLFGILHNCSMGFTERGNWAPLTQRGAASALASIWTGIDQEKADYVYWYSRWLLCWGGPSAFGKLEGDELELLDNIRARLQSHSSVEYVTPEAEDDGFPGWPGRTS